MNRRVFTLALIGMGLLIGSASSFAQGDRGGLAGMTAQWWQTMLSIPTSVNPLLDRTGADCMIGQRDPRWFLAGSFTSSKVSRNCTIPAGEAVLFPVINNVVMNTPNVCGQGASETVDQLRAQIAPYIDAVTVASATFDGKPVGYILRIKSDAFAATLPVDNIYNQPCIDAGLGPQPAGVFAPSVDDGYYGVLPPLSAGKHTLRIHAEVSGSPAVDVIYKLTVVASPAR